MLGPILIAIAGLIHVSIFALESFLWGHPKTNRIFGVSKDGAEATRDFAFNQGFYNLFLAVMTILGLAMRMNGNEAGTTLIFAGALSMLAAALVLFWSKPKMLRGVLIQGFAPAAGLICLWFGL